jgi:excisionase family DNA binding protein
MHSETQEPLILKLSQVAMRLGVCEKTVKRAINAGKLKAYRHRASQVVKPEDLQDYVDNLKPVRRVNP